MTIRTTPDIASAPTPTIRSILRDTSAEAHQRLDQRFAGLNFAQADDYRAFLLAQAHALVPLEISLEIAGIAHVFHDWPERSRRDALLADLRALGESPTVLPLRLKDAGEAALYGMLYTLEGSRLGARYILRTMEQHGTTDLPCAFLRHGEKSGLWARYCAALEAADAVHADMRRTVDGALFAFSIFDRAAGQLPEKAGVN